MSATDANLLDLDIGEFDELVSSRSSSDSRTQPWLRQNQSTTASAGKSAAKSSAKSANGGKKSQQNSNEGSDWEEFSELDDFAAFPGNHRHDAIDDDEQPAEEATKHRETRFYQSDRSEVVNLIYGHESKRLPEDLEEDEEEDESQLFVSNKNPKSFLRPTRVRTFLASDLYIRFNACPIFVLL